ncbi:MAG: hypothetical protein KatS3mg119_0960 [Rhodothalassiaceae bacterium]|nr:MAG: hypothetical protein KatS3mg119_0960 [Rhodothalassiaceae bacterium]
MAIIRLAATARRLVAVLLFLLPAVSFAAGPGTTARPGQDGTDAPPWEHPEWRQAVASLDACLAVPTRGCALASALLVTARQDLAIDRVDNLIALARSFLALGENARARQVLRLAEQAAEGIGIAIGTERKLAEIAPLYGLAGDPARAEELLARIGDATTRAAAMVALAENLARAGQVEAAVALTERIDKPWLALDALDRVIRAAAARDGEVPADLLARLERRIDGLPRYILSDLARAHLALLLARRGEVERARAMWQALDARLTGLGPAAEEVRLAAALLPVDRALGETQAGAHHLAIIARRVEHLGIDDDRRHALAEAATALALAGRDAEARAVLALAGDDYRLLLDLAGALLEAGAPPELLAAAADRVLDAAAAQELRAERDRGRLVAVRLLVAAGRRDAAIAAVRAVEDPGLKARALAMLAPLLS